MDAFHPESARRPSPPRSTATSAALSPLVRGLLLAPVVATLFAMASPTGALASGFYMPGRGVRPMGRGGAYVASGGGNLNSLWYNPANLATLQDTQLTLDMAIIGTFSKFDRAPRETEGGGTVEYPQVSNQSAPDPDPQALIGGETGIDGLTWAAGLWAPYASHQKFPQDGPQRYSLVDNSKSLLAYLGVAVAWEATEDLRIGGGFQNMVSNFEFVTYTSAYTGVFGRPEDRDLDALSKAKVRDLFVPTGNLGIWYEPVDHFQVAASMQLPAKVVDKNGKIQHRLPSHPAFADAEIPQPTFRGELTFPLMARAALRYSRDSFDIELTGVFEQWSVFDEIRVDPQNMRVENVPGVGALPLGALTIPKEWNDTFSIRTGGAYHLNSSVTARLGYIYETGAPPRDRYSIFAPDPNKHVFSGGFTYDWGTLELDVSAAYYAMENRTIENSKVRQINPVDTADELATVIANGSYKNAMLIVGTGINYRF